MDLKKLFNIENKDIITIVGAGGKTSLMMALSKEFRNEKTLITTTTKIFLPESKDYDHIYMGNKFNELNYNKKGIWVIGVELSKENKIYGISHRDLEGLAKNFNYIFIEGDGSKRKSLKGWREDEPLVPNITTKTLGVVSLKALDLIINCENVHRLEKFLQISKGIESEKVSYDHLVNMIFNENGLFKNSRGKRILVINAVDNEEDKEKYYKLKKLVEKTNKNYIDKVVGVSLKKEKVIYD
ncbi:selenium cofactor biosynthesis protein YqeC [Clostridium hydrogeniformans]|uniref:selenium cofactor biosynthesis protein YqeC n=1 Tax=Clostridium hydrogeniformans TaxID=349933 RepID=UPI00048026DE|nr:selenium cofactor biosynthesis protein YqeC [Clostridium hydrogeniformans]